MNNNKFKLHSNPLSIHAVSEPTLEQCPSISYNASEYRNDELESPNTKDLLNNIKSTTVHLPTTHTYHPQLTQNSDFIACSKFLKRRTSVGAHSAASLSAIFAQVGHGVNRIIQCLARQGWGVVFCVPGVPLTVNVVRDCDRLWRRFLRWRCRHYR